MKIGVIKNGERHTKFFQINQLTAEQIKAIEKLYDEFVEEQYPEVKSIPKSLRTFSLEVTGDIICLRSVYIEEQSLIQSFRNKIMETF